MAIATRETLKLPPKSVIRRICADYQFLILIQQPVTIISALCYYIELQNSMLCYEPLSIYSVTIHSMYCDGIIISINIKHLCKKCALRKLSHWLSIIKFKKNSVIRLNHFVSIANFVYLLVEHYVCMYYSVRSIHPF